MSDSLWPHGLQHTRLPCPSPTPSACSNPCPLSRWCHPTISSSVVQFFSCLQSFPASGSFLMSRFFASGGQSIGASASGSVLLINIQDLFPLGWTVGTPCGPRDSQEFLQHHSSKASILPCSAFFMVQLSHPYMTTGKTIALTRWTYWNICRWEIIFKFFENKFCFGRFLHSTYIHCTLENGQLLRKSAVFRFTIVFTITKVNILLNPHLCYKSYVFSISSFVSPGHICCLAYFHFKI